MYSIFLDLFKKTDIKKTKRLNPLLRAVYSTMCFPLFQISVGLGRRYIYIIARMMEIHVIYISLHLRYDRPLSFPRAYDMGPLRWNSF